MFGNCPEIGFSEEVIHATRIAPHSKSRVERRTAFRNLDRLYRCRLVICYSGWRLVSRLSCSAKLNRIAKSRSSSNLLASCPSIPFARRKTATSSNSSTLPPLTAGETLPEVLPKEIFLPGSQVLESTISSCFLLLI